MVCVRSTSVDGAHAAHIVAEERRAPSLQAGSSGAAASAAEEDDAVSLHTAACDGDAELLQALLSLGDVEVDERCAFRVGFLQSISCRAVVRTSAFLLASPDGVALLHARLR